MITKAFLMWLSHAQGVWNSYIPTPKQPERESGQGLVEYALIMVLVGVAATAILVTMGPTLGNLYENIINTVIDTIE